MIGTMAVCLVLLSLLYPVLTRESYPFCNRQRLVIEFEERQIIKGQLKKLRMKPISKESEIVMNDGSISFIGGWKSKPRLRNRVLGHLKKNNIIVISKVLVSLISVFAILHITNNPLSFIGLLGAAFTSKASGDWDAVGQTTWNEVGSPVSGDTSQINNTHVVRVDVGTGNMACLSCNVQVGGELVIDREAGGAISFTFDDAVGAGFAASGGTLTTIGGVGNMVTITSAGSPPGTYWDGTTTMSVTLDYTTISYAISFRTTGSWDVDDCIFNNFSGTATVVYILAGSTITSFTNNTITSSGAIPCLASAASYDGFDNITLSGSTIDVYLIGLVRMEFVNSIFDITKVSFHVSSSHSWLISETHGGVANAYNIVVQRATNVRTKSTIVNDFDASDNVTLYAVGSSGTGTFQANETISNADFTIKNNCELEIDAGITWTITAGETVTLESGGTLDITGSAGNLITIVSSSPGTQWFLDAQSGSTVTASYVDVTDSDASAGEAIDATDGTSVGRAQNNLNWDWPPVAGGGGPNTKLILPLELSS